MGLAYSIILTAISIRGGGGRIRGMVRAHIGFRRGKINLEGNTLAIGNSIEKKEEAPCFIKMVIDMMEFGLMINPMDKEEKFIKMVMSIKDYGI